MPNTHGFELISQVTVQVLREILNAAWKSADNTSGEGVIPEKFEIPAGINMGPYMVKEGTVQIPKEQLNLDMDTTINGVDIKLGTIVHVEINNPPIPSATFFDLTADINIKTPVVTLDGDTNVGVRLENLPADQVSATITSGNPIEAITSAMVEEYVHQKLRNDSDFPTIYDNIDILFPPFRMTGRLELYDDESDPSKKTTVSFPDSDNVKVSIPCYMRFYDIEGSFAGQSLATPMGITGTIEMLSDYSVVNNVVTAELSNATITLENIQPAPGEEGVNYNTNVFLTNFKQQDILENTIKNYFGILAQAQLTQIGNVQETVPSVSQIEDFIEQQVRKELNTRKQILIWEPSPPDGGDVTVNDITPKALNEGMAIAINDLGGANGSAITFFVPDNRDFATAISESKVIQQIDKSIDEEFGDLPTDLDPIEGHDVRLNSLDISLKTGAIDIEGEVTVIDAILGSIDVDADFDADAGLRWIDSGGNGQIIEPFVIGEPDVDLSLLAWILSFLIGFITFGIIGGIIVLVVLSLAESLAERIGGEIIRDDVSDQLVGIGAWPQALSNIGTITARFENPIDIDSNSILFSGSMIVTSTYALTSEDFAKSNGPYNNIGGQTIIFDGGIEKATSETFWDFDDNHSSIIRKPSHVYGKSGLYIAKLRINVNENGGVTTRHFAKVKVQNVSPQVFMPQTITANEGEEITIRAQFTDANWLDSHTASIDWGDNTAPEELVVTETNKQPQAQGEIFACHAYCDNGNYTVKLTIRDDVGGIGIGQMKIVINNVNPEVFLTDKMYSLKNQCVQLIGNFEDVGWCDTHVGLWILGDCNTRDAVIEEENKKPKAVGTAKVRHVYKNCGIYQVELQIKDDDNGVGRDTTCLEVNQLKNHNFEKGFYNLHIREGKEDVIANSWLPFAHFVDTTDKAAISGQRNVLFNADQFIISDGQRAQNIKVQGAMRAGIMQYIKVNKGWDYEFNGQFHIPLISGAKAVIGIDPLGGNNINSSSIVWKESSLHLQWKNVSIRTTARKEKITLFLGIIQREATESEIFWDESSLFQIQPYCNEQACESTCINFIELKESISIKKAFQYKGLDFIPGNEGLFTSTFGEPADQVKLGFHSGGMRINFPDIVNGVKLTISNHNSKLITIHALYQDEIIGSFKEIIYNETKVIDINEDQMSGLIIEGGKSEASLVEICLCLPENIEEREIDFNNETLSRQHTSKKETLRFRNIFENLDF
jgi:hypothetical protein